MKYNFEWLRFRRNRVMVQGAIAVLSLSAVSAVSAQELDEVTVGMSWYAQAEHGGFYQAKAEGIYENHGLDVTIRDGGPNVNGMQLLMGGATDFQTGYSLNTLNAVKQGIPLVTIAAIMQKDPQTLVAHKGVGHDSLEKLKGEPIKIPTAGRVAYWPWLKAKYDYSDSQLRPYDYNFGPFVADEQAIQQGYITNDGYFLAQAGAEAQSILLADNGWSPYAYTIDTTQQTIDAQPELVQRFVDATVEGYRRYFENPAPGNALIQERNADQADALLVYSLDKMKQYGIVKSGDAEQYGIGAMSDARWQTFFQQMVDAKVLPADLDYEKGYALEFIDHP
ncbi:NMT1/THI5 like protein [Salinisphaera shabanensis E1L3A]|uniref:NMT1/THI5 like protein n=2 Tax=Salinisphaera shabanensis TaxID=180542 RepID=U2E7A9_9GAMM|nr:NMT1/THI5 like protein [Salinisphaera shabanensis E1L3A]